MTTDLVEFLQRRLADDETVAQGVSTGGDGAWEIFEVGDGAGYGMLRIDSARLLAEVEVKRAMLRYYAQACTAAAGLVDADEIGGRLAMEFFWSATLRLLVQPYATHPDFDPAWSVSAGVR